MKNQPQNSQPKTADHPQDENFQFPTPTEVTDKKTAKEFLRVSIRLYRNHPTWIRPLDKDINEVFDPKKNKAFRHGEAIRWILKDKEGKLIGRIAAFYNRKTAGKNKQPTGGTGFFECIDDQEAANLLFGTAKKWLQEKGMEAMDGPINFGERDRWWGCLVDGFDIEPNYRCNYNFPYYRQLFENYGFKTFFEQYTYSRDVQLPLPEDYAEKSDRIAENPKYRFEIIDPKNLEKYAEDFVTIYNKAWVKHGGVAKLRKSQIMAQFKQMKPVMDKNIVWYTYYEEEPVGFFVMLPELNQLFKYVNGKLDWLGKLIFAYHQWRGTNRKIFGLVFGIVPEHQGKGLVGAMVSAVGRHIQPINRYDHFEMNWIGDFNPVMMKLAESIGSEIVKTHITYRYLFDRKAEFERHPVLE